MIPLLTPLFQGQLASYAETLECAPHHPPGALSIAQLVEQEPLLAGVIRRYANHLGAGDDLRAAASAWSLGYLWALLPPVAAAASVLQHGFPIAAGEIAVSLDRAGAPARFHILHEGAAMAGEPAAARYAALLERHLEPLFGALARQTRLPKKILWGNTARYLEAILDQALALTSNAAHVAADRDTMLHQPHWQGAINPLYARQREAMQMRSGQPVAVKLHRQCCLCYRLPGHDYCGICPLAPEHRAAHIRARSRTVS